VSHKHYLTHDKQFSDTTHYYLHPNTSINLTPYNKTFRKPQQ